MGINKGHRYRRYVYSISLKNPPKTHSENPSSKEDPTGSIVQQPECYNHLYSLNAVLTARYYMMSCLSFFRQTELQFQSSNITVDLFVRNFAIKRHFLGKFATKRDSRETGYLKTSLNREKKLDYSSLQFWRQMFSDLPKQNQQILRLQESTKLEILLLRLENSARTLEDFEDSVVASGSISRNETSFSGWYDRWKVNSLRYIDARNMVASSIWFKTSEQLLKKNQSLDGFHTVAGSRSDCSHDPKRKIDIATLDIRIDWRQTEQTFDRVPKIGTENDEKKTKQQQQQQQSAVRLNRTPIVRGSDTAVLAIGHGDSRFHKLENCPSNSRFDFNVCNNRITSGKSSKRDYLGEDKQIGGEIIAIEFLLINMYHLRRQTNRNGGNSTSSRFRTRFSVQKCLLYPSIARHPIDINVYSSRRSIGHRTPYMQSRILISPQVLSHNKHKLYEIRRIKHKFQISLLIGKYAVKSRPRRLKYENSRITRRNIEESIKVFEKPRSWCIDSWPPRRLNYPLCLFRKSIFRIALCCFNSVVISVVTRQDC
ncbi:hypothetical protein WN51_04091 [Melipona quadrifasciata]|uniref:Uncharacterized protein n=1 Tax=Melipona quadrifasciata TaxID=166423 RepID=A0A0M8ZPS6_9HYME|nr:hypothetical protein WN51_04091 [Melipona quadrifasciata]